jgi:hypothetical protein
MTLKKTFFINFLSALSIFVLVASPTLKGVVYSSSIFNFIPFFLFSVVIVLQGSVNRVFKTLINSLVPLFLIFLILFVYVYVIYFGFPDLVEFIKYIMLFLIVIIIPHALTLKALDISYILLFLWGVFLALKKVFFTIQFTDEFHYLTLGLAIAVMIIISFFKLIYEKNFFFKLIFFGGLFIGYLALLTLQGRSPLLFPTLLIVSYLFFNFFNGLVNFKVKNTIKYLLVLIGLFVVIKVIIENYIPVYLLDKFSQMEIGNSDSRTDDLYIPAMHSIVSNPLGTGLGSSQKIIGYYPHNIFLEIGIDCGFVGILFFLILIMRAFSNSVKILKMKDSNVTLIIMIFIFWLIFLFWNVSYGLSSAYALFAFLSLMHSYKFIKVKSFQN